MVSSCPVDGAKNISTPVIELGAHSVSVGIPHDGIDDPPTSDLFTPCVGCGPMDKSP